jgi:predicted HTH domain antitoxin
MQITVELPDDLAEHPNAAREALEAFAIEGYRSGALSAYQTRLLLGFETRYELDGFLRDHGVWEHAYDVEDLAKDAAGFERHG